MHVYTLYTARAIGSRLTLVINCWSLILNLAVNNVGITYEYPDYFNEVDTEVN
jgi:hypothetical protein